MTRFVLDASVALSWCFADEADAISDGVLRSLQTGSAAVPAIWPLEVGNVLLAAERRKRLSPADSSRFVGLLHSLPIEVDAFTAARGLREVLAVARQYQMTSYDAAYLELALRHGLPLATRDKRLATTAKSAGIELLIALV